MSTELIVICVRQDSEQSSMKLCVLAGGQIGRQYVTCTSMNDETWFDPRLG